MKKYRKYIDERRWVILSSQEPTEVQISKLNMTFELEDQA